MATSIVYFQLSTNDYLRAKDFYSGLFGWRAEGPPPSAPEYSEMFAAQGVKPIAGIMPASPPDAPSRWIPVIEVADVVASSQKAQTLGGVIAVAPVDIPGKGKYSVVVDPTGAAVALFKPLPAGG